LDFVNILFWVLGVQHYILNLLNASSGAHLSIS
jgi:hypothetical protein